MVKNNSRPMFPSQEELKRVRKEIATSDHRVNIGLSLNATPMEKAKYGLCQEISRYQRENNLSEPELAQKLGITEKIAEYILFAHINKLTLDKLIDYANNLRLTTEIKIPLPYERNEKQTAHPR
jgi:Helix-turn-helix domain